MVISTPNYELKARQLGNFALNNMDPHNWIIVILTPYQNRGKFMIVYEPWTRIRDTNMRQTQR